MKLNSLFPNKKLQEKDLIYSVPFYGIKGSISKVKDDGNQYLVTRYDVNGKDGEVFPISKKKQKELIKNYVSDVKKYLEINKAKYVTLLNNQSKIKHTKLEKTILTTVYTLISTASIIGLIFATGSISYVCLATFFVSFIATCNEFNILKKDNIEGKNQEFIHKYKNYMIELNKHSKEKQYSKTKYSTISESNTETVIDINKRKVLNKNEKNK